MASSLSSALPTISHSVWLTLAVAAASAAVAVLLGELAAFAVRRLGHRRPILVTLGRRVRRPLAGLLAIVAVQVSLNIYTGEADWRPPTFFVLKLLTVAFVAWLAVVAANAVQDVVLRRYPIDVEDNRRARQRRTQVTLLKRVVVVLVIVVAAASMLLTIPGARAAGASVLASAGLLSVVAGLAAQTSLANVFAGLQIAFTDGLRVDDVVVIEGEWGNVEDITLTYVVVRVWDKRRLILPSTYFTTTPFENWTRNSADVIGTVEFDVDWRVPVGAVREHAERFVHEHPLWNGKALGLQVLDAKNSFVTFRVLVSANSGGQLFDLRCAVREELVGWLQREHPQALPRVRVETGTPLPRQAPRAGARDGSQDGSRSSAGDRLGGVTADRDSSRR
ncbi:mechanosensitive ion channel family protein [Paenibacillus sp. TRM 82003]|uniref:mechanosensitive ion channel family protein n=1 Tax=Kineococcus sp. TRM81007 TaxID=2925831 RepID=UPI001F5AEFB7|nr:mechanosensitive ion channel domain-containing protein [Kineococcus sp. TRM81007]MCI2239237.1 mechanosensitive ion channel family protein [Kineococcus sp. TRM81007]MCI3924919.1 mechanosensitive ion channel family protein [Paenibacillus sp. TRM 82003]